MTGSIGDPASALQLLGDVAIRQTHAVVKDCMQKSMI